MVSRIAEVEQMKYAAVAMYIAFLYCELRRRNWAKRTRRGEIKSMDELREEACTEDEVTLRNARSKVSAFMEKACALRRRRFLR